LISGLLPFKLYLLQWEIAQISLLGENMVEYTITLKRTYLNSCDLTFPDGNKIFMGDLELGPGVTLSIQMEPKGDTAPQSPPQLTNICVITIEGTFRVKSHKLEKMTPSDQLAELHDQGPHFKDRFRPLIDAAVLFLSTGLSPFLFYELKSEFLTMNIGKHFVDFMDRDTSTWYQRLKGKVGSQKLQAAFHHLNLLKLEDQEIFNTLGKSFHWYAIAIERKDPTDSFIAAFAGLEVVLYTEKLPKSKEHQENLKQIEELIKSSESENKEELLGFIANQKSSILRPPLRLRLETLLTRANSLYKEEELKAFDTVNDIRNELLHGRSIEIPNMPLIAINPKPFDNPLQAVLTLLQRCIFYALKTRYSPQKDKRIPQRELKGNPINKPHSGNSPSSVS